MRWPHLQRSTKDMIFTLGLQACVALIVYMCMYMYNMWIPERPISDFAQGSKCSAELIETNEQLQGTVNAIQLQLIKATSELDATRDKMSHRISELEGRLNILAAKKANRSDMDHLSEMYITRSKHEAELATIASNLTQLWEIVMKVARKENVIDLYETLPGASYGRKSYQTIVDALAQNITALAKRAATKHALNELLTAVKLFQSEMNDQIAKVDDDIQQKVSSMKTDIKRLSTCVDDLKAENADRSSLHQLENIKWDVARLRNRITHLEKQKDAGWEHWQGIVSVVALIIAILACCVSCAAFNERH